MRPTNTCLGTGALERLDSMLDICELPPGALPESCAKTCADGWQVIDALLTRHGNVSSISETACAVVRRALEFFGPLFHPIAPAVLSRMASCFQATGLPGYIWITGKITSATEGTQQPELLQAIASALDVESQKMFELLASQPVAQISDG